MSKYTAPRRKSQIKAAQYKLQRGKVSFAEYHLALLPLYEKN